MLERLDAAEEGFMKEAGISEHSPSVSSSYTVLASKTQLRALSSISKPQPLSVLGFRLPARSPTTPSCLERDHPKGCHGLWGKQGQRQRPSEIVLNKNSRKWGGRERRGVELPGVIRVFVQAKKNYVPSCRAVERYDKETEARQFPQPLGLIKCFSMST